jgi:uncharacterized protein (TIGR04255 family)
LTAEQPYRILRHPPIVEGLLDIQFDALTSDRLSEIETLGQQFPDYPTKNPRMSVIGNVQLAAGTSEGSFTHNIIGYQFWNTTRTRVVQVRLDGITISLLAPYTKFEDLQHEAQRVWSVFTAAIGRPKIKRLGVRYINRLELPLPLESFNQFLNTVPELAPGIPQGLSHYSMRLTIPDTETASTAIVTQVMEGHHEDAASLPLLFDIDVFHALDDDVPDEMLWSIVAELRQYKNRIFFNSITPELERMLQ